jgi:CRISPR-associated endonuclease/helicase Cas3
VELTPQEQSDIQCSPREVTLLDHSTAVSDRAFRFATKVLPKIYSQVLKIVGRFHDVGKNDRRTQGFFRGSAIWDHSLPALAKSLRRYSQKEDAEIRKQTKFLLGLRHEALSAALFQQGVKDGKINLDGCEKYIDLILYLLWTHHGHRPLLPPPPPEADAIKVSTPPNFPGVAGEISISSDHGLEKFDCPCPEIFCQLQSEYGWWGLAYLEAFIRLADQWESAK